MNAFASLVAAALLLPAASLAAPPAPSAPDAPASGASCPLVAALGALTSGRELRVDRLAQRAAIRDARAGHDLLVATCDRLEVPAAPRRADRAAPPATEVARDARGQVVFVRTTTALGARVTVIEPGHVNRDGLHVIAFDNDDVHVSDGLGALVFSRQTLPDGTLVERDPAGCACERRTDADGRVTSSPLPAAR